VRLSLVGIGRVEGDTLEWLCGALSEVLGWRCRLEEGMEVCPGYNPLRGQYSAEVVLWTLSRRHTGRVLGVVSEDIYAEPMNFVFGLAELRGRAAVVSTFRLRHPERRRFRERLLKEALHELGHTLGMRHCTSPCVMSFSNSLAEVDEKSTEFCQEHLRMLRKSRG